MYSLILMSAMAGTPDVAAFGYGTGCAGSSASYAASYSYSYSSGSGCSGPAFPVLSGLAQGTRRFVGGAARLVASPFRSMGCYSSACYGSGYGSACYGSCYGSSSFGSACYGSCYGSGSGASCFGSAPVIYGGESYGAPVGEHYGTVCLSGAGTDTVVAARPTVTVEVAGDDKATASLSVELPAAAKLYVDGHLIAGGGEARQFHTPELPRGQAFFYEVKAEVEVNGTVEVESKRVVVKAGESLRESFPKLLASVKSAAGPAMAAK